jgi:uncharacterized GH25 family protein
MSALDGWPLGDAVVASLEVLALTTAVVGLGWVAERFLARRAALWLAVLAGVLLTPALALIGRHLPWRVAVFPPANPVAGHSDDGPPEPSPAFAAAPDHSDVAKRAPSAEATGTRGATPPTRDPAPAASRPEEPTSGPAEAETPLGVADSPAAPSAFRAVSALALLGWGLGSAYLIGRSIHGAWRVRRLWHLLRPLDRVRWREELRAAAGSLAVSPPDVFLCPGVRSPLVAGLFPSRVILPESLPERAPGCLPAVLVHEFAHVARRDPWARLLQRLAAALLWVHPLVHLLNRRLDQAREEVCDNYVLACTDAPAYAEVLLAVSRTCYPTPRLEGYLTMMPRHYPLERRVVDLLEERRDTSTRLRGAQRAALLAAFALLLAAAASVGLSAAGPQAAPKGAPPAAAPGGVKVAGEVIHAADGSRAAGAIVWAAKQSYGPLERREVVADEKGRYALALSPGQWYIWARRGTQGGEAELQHGRIDIVAGTTPPPIKIRLEERGTFRGRLLEAETGKPIPGGKLILDAGLVLAADAAGKFQVGGLARKDHEGFVVAPGQLRMRVLFDTTASVDTELDVPVARAGKIVGRVTDAGGKPIPGAQVGRSTSGSFFSINALYEACDKEGRFEYDGVAPDQRAGLTATAPGYAEEDRGADVPPVGGKPAVMDFRLRPKPGTPAGDRRPDAEKRRAVAGVVQGPGGKPVPGVLVRWGYSPFSDAAETRTDAAGRFRLVVPDKANLLAVLPSDFQPEFPPVAAGGDQEVKVTLREGQTAKGQVLDDAGKPIANVQVVAVIPSPDPRFGNPFWLTEAAVYTDLSGRFEMKGVPRSGRFDFLKRGLSDLRNRELDLARNDNAVTMLHGGALSGRVVDRDGKPIRDFRVLVHFPRERKKGDRTAGFFAGYTGIGVRFTSADGRFVLTGVGAGCVYRVTVIAEGHGEAVADRVTAIAVNRVQNAEPATLRAGPPVPLRVRVVAEGGKPINDAHVTLMNGATGLDESFNWNYLEGGWNDVIRDRTAEDGRANFPALSFAGATVLVRAPGFARRRMGWRDGSKELTCELAKEAVIAGRVIDAAGKPVKAFYVQLRKGGDQISTSAGADHKGKFRVAELPAGTWEVTVRSTDGNAILYQKDVKVVAGETKEVKVESKE